MNVSPSVLARSHVRSTLRPARAQLHVVIDRAGILLADLHELRRLIAEAKQWNPDHPVTTPLERIDRGAAGAMDDLANLMLRHGLVDAEAL